MRKPHVNTPLDAELVAPDCVCNAQQIDRAKALVDLRAMAIGMCGEAGSNRQLLDFCLDVINRTRGLC